MTSIIKDSSNMSTFKANPIEVEAKVIESIQPLEVGGTLDLAFQVGMKLTLEDGTIFNAPKAMFVRYMPKEGDYLVTQADGYRYINPREVFQRKYSPVVTE